MYGHGPLSDQPYVSLRTSTLIPFPNLGAAWSVVPARLEHGPLDVVFAAAAGSFNLAPLLNVLYAVERAPADELYVSAAWAVDPAIAVEQPFGFSYGVEPVGLQDLPIDAKWATKAGSVLDLPLDGAWSVFGAPQASVPLGVVYDVAPVVQQLALVEAAWRVAELRDGYLPFESSWGVSIPSVDELSLDVSWFWSYMVARALEIAYPSQVRRALDMPYEIGTARVRRALEVPSPLLTRVRRECVIDYPIQAFDQVRRALEIRYPILDGSVIIAIGAPTLEVRGRTLVIEDAEVSAEEGRLWTCNVTLPDPADLALFGEDEPFTITLGGEAFSFIRDDARLVRSGPVGVDAVISGISPAAVYAEPRAEKITKTWQAATLASAVLEELFGADVVELRGVIDWAIAAGRLSVTGQPPMDTGSSIAGAPGGVLESDPDGSLYIRPLWPVSVPFLADETPDHLYDDARDAFTLEERIGTARIANRIRVLDAADAASGVLAAELDAREDGYNKGRTRFLPGDQPALLIYTSQSVELDDVRSSAGHISTLAPGTREIEEESLSFTDTAEATLQYPTTALTSWKWLGNDLGTPELADELTVRIPAAGVGILLVTYETAFLARRLSGVPVKLAGEDEYDVLVLVEGSQH